jgi:hypothetical protein
VKAKIVNFIADVEISQRFVNDNTYPIEAVYDLIFCFLFSLSITYFTCTLALKFLNNSIRFRFENHNAEMTNFQVTVDGKVCLYSLNITNHNNNFVR